jgi:hypothetical protein
MLDKENGYQEAMNRKLQPTHKHRLHYEHSIDILKRIIIYETVLGQHKDTTI